MEPNILEVLNIIAILGSPIIAVFIGKYLQNRSEHRKDKWRFLKC